MRREVGRRVLLAGGATVAGGTLALAWRAGKPGTVPVHTPVTDAEADASVRLQGIAALRPTEPPAKLAGAALVDADGAHHAIEDFAGRGLVLNLWATWCVPCVAELPALATLARRVRDAGILVLALSSDRGGAAMVSRFYETHGISGLGVWLDPHGAAARAWGARGVPTTLLVDRAGRERGRLEGAADWGGDAAVAAVRRLAGSAAG